MKQKVSEEKELKCYIEWYQRKMKKTIKEKKPSNADRFLSGFDLWVAQHMLRHENAGSSLTYIHGKPKKRITRGILGIPKEEINGSERQTISHYVDYYFEGWDRNDFRRYKRMISLIREQKEKVEKEIKR